MLKVISKIKEGNKVKYECKNDSLPNLQTSVLSKEELINNIQNGNVINARIQDYKGQLIIRIKEDKDTNIEKQTRKSKKKEVYAIDLYKSIMRAFQIKQEELALAVGFDNYDLSEDLTNSTSEYIDKLSYQMASDIKKVADVENGQLLMQYRNKYLELRQ